MNQILSLMPAYFACHSLRFLGVEQIVEFDPPGVQAQHGIGGTVDIAPAYSQVHIKCSE